jgi:hypothetical protein
MVINFLRSSWECGNPSQAATSVFPSGLLLGLDRPDLSVEFALAGKH